MEVEIARGLIRAGPKSEKLSPARLPRGIFLLFLGRLFIRSFYFRKPFPFFSISYTTGFTKLRQRLFVHLHSAAFSSSSAAFFIDSRLDST
ncbi:hypothetical protein TSAR_008568 [Trichomalopsis sarcophagae]|uniref:Uncharacterized protein n=1 Tax=Trichomalopsis sarcophagae TaxID=543379 RepID=A0A232FG57_9HYME|nr:hypothetical protein TSAR_008568 [Trichomalopsis sarcophagae]